MADVTYYRPGIPLPFVAKEDPDNPGKYLDGSSSSTGTLSLEGEGIIGGAYSLDAVLVHQPTLTVGTAYASGDYMGVSGGGSPPNSFSGAARFAGKGGVIRSLVLEDHRSGAVADMELWLFSDTFAAPVDNAPWALSSNTDRRNVQAIIDIPAAASPTRWHTDSNGRVYVYSGLWIPYTCVDTALPYALKALGATPAYVTGDLQLTLGVTLN